MKVLSTEGLTKLIDLIKSNFISSADVETTNEVTLATVATTGAYSDLSGTPTVDQTYDGTSANAQSGVAVASAISGKADDSAVVHKTGDETITGIKTFDNNLIRMNNNITKGTNPSSKTYNAVEFTDKNGYGSMNRVGLIETSIETSGLVSTYIASYKYENNSTDFAYIAIKYPTTGNPYALAPASDVNGSIVTTVTKTKNGNGGFKFGNGLIINFGHISSTNWSSNTYDVVYSIPFTTYGRIGFCRTSAATTTNDGGDYYARNPTTTGFNAYRTVTNTASIDWVAIGY